KRRIANGLADRIGSSRCALRCGNVTRLAIHRLLSALGAVGPARAGNALEEGIFPEADLASQRFVGDRSLRAEIGNCQIQLLRAEAPDAAAFDDAQGCEAGQEAEELEGIAVAGSPFFRRL